MIDVSCGEIIRFRKYNIRYFWAKAPLLIGKKDMISNRNDLKCDYNGALYTYSWIYDNQYALLN